MEKQESYDAPLMAIDQYMREVRRVVRLTPEEEKGLLQVIERAKESPGNQWLAMRAKHAREQLIEGYQPLVIAVAKSLTGLVQGRGIDRLDLIQEGNIGLLDALEAGCVGKVRSFHSYAAVAIRHAMIDALYAQSDTARGHWQVRGRLRNMRDVEQRLVSVLGRVPTLAEVAREIGIAERSLFEALEWERCVQASSLQALCVGYDGEEIEDYYELRSAFVSSAVDGDAVSEKAQQVQQALESLSPRRREVMRLRYGLDGGRCHTEQETCDLLGLGSAKAVSTHASRAKKRLREVLSSLVDGQMACHERQAMSV